MHNKFDKFGYLYNEIGLLFQSNTINEKQLLIINRLQALLIYIDSNNIPSIALNRLVYERRNVLDDQSCISKDSKLYYEIQIIQSQFVKEYSIKNIA